MFGGIGDSTLSSAVSVLSAMITPAVLILACGSLLITTSNRLTRVVDRVREVSTEIEELARSGDDNVYASDRRAMLFDLLEFAMTRGRYLQRAITSLYSALGTFLLTSLVMGVLTLTGFKFAMVALLLSFVGAGLMLLASGLMILESRVGIRSLDAETDFLWRRGQHHAPPGRVIEERRRWWSRHRAATRPPMS